MNKKVFDAIYEFLEANQGFTAYKIDGYYGFAYLLIDWADEPAKYKFNYDYLTHQIIRTRVIE